MPASTGGSDDWSPTPTAKLQRRLMSLPRKKWDSMTSFLVIVHTETGRSLATLDQLSDCLARAAEHLRSLDPSEQDMMVQQIFSCEQHSPTVFSHLCSGAGFALQQLAEGMQQYLQQGQLPAALTVHAVEACCSLLYMLALVYFRGGMEMLRQSSENRQQLHLQQQNTGEPTLVPTSFRSPFLTQWAAKEPELGIH
jgi:hypothetical protein